MKLASVADFRARAKKRLPKFAFDFLDGGAGSELGLRRSESAFEELVLRPRYLVNVEKRTLATTLFGRRWSAPLATAPVGLGNLFWPGAEEAIARAAVEAGIPYTIATAGTTSLERIKEIAGDNAWFMLYPGRAEEIVADLVDRADAAGYEVMVVSVDIPLSAIRPRDIRNDFITPFRITPRIVWEIVTHPQWSLATLAAGPPRPVNMDKYEQPRPGQTMPSYSRSQATGRFDWESLKALRDRWRGRIVIKGLLAADDVVRARAIGCDGVVVSNHGGRQLDSLPTPIEVLPEIRAAVGPDFPILMDGGIRSGEHIIKALALGADFVLSGRAIMYAAGALGRAGGKAGIKLLLDEAAHCLGQIGYTDVASLKASAPVVRRP